MPAERPILFSAPMVLAILEGRKTQTRRVVKPQGPMQPECWDNCIVRRGRGHSGVGWYAWDDGCEDEGAHLMRCPYGVPGDRLWVRETWRPRVSANGHSRGVEYSADGRMSLTEMPSGIGNKVTSFIPLHLWAPSQHAEMKAFCDRWRPSIHMPRWASRLTLEVVAVRVERLNEISERDATAEGVYLGTARETFQVLWDSINAKKHPWSSNPWVWVVEFKKLEVSDAR